MKGIGNVSVPLVLLYDFNEGPQKPQRGGMCVAQGVSLYNYTYL